MDWMDCGRTRQIAEVTRMDGDNTARLDAAAKLADPSLAQAIYAEIANDPSNCSGLRLAAAERLADLSAAQTVYAEMATKRSGYGPTRLAATVKLTDQSILTQLATTDGDHDIRLVAAERLLDRSLAQSVAQAIYAEVAKDPSNCSGLRLDAAKKLGDQTVAQAVHAEVANSDRHSPELRLAAAERLSDQRLAQSVYADIARTTREQLVHLCSEEESRKREQGR